MVQSQHALLPVETSVHEFWVQWVEKTTKRQKTNSLVENMLQANRNSDMQASISAQKVSQLTGDLQSMCLWLSLLLPLETQRGVADASVFSCLLNLWLMSEFWHYNEKRLSVFSSCCDCDNYRPIPIPRLTASVIKLEHRLSCQHCEPTLKIMFIIGFDLILGTRPFSWSSMMHDLQLLTHQIVVSLKYETVKQKAKINFKAERSAQTGWDSCFGNHLNQAIKNLTIWVISPHLSFIGFNWSHFTTLSSLLLFF